jgi:hypothetical protein
MEKNDEIFGTFSLPVPSVPHDEEGFCQSFTVDQPSEYMSFFNTYGFVVIRNILSSDQCTNSINEIWQFIESRNWRPFQSQTVSRHNPETWRDTIFPVSSDLLGILGGEEGETSIYEGPMAWKTRQNENLYKVFSTIYQQKNLWVSVDRIGLMRPTVNVPLGNLPVQNCRISVENTPPGLPRQDFPEWKTRSLWLHWDLNPWIWTHSHLGLDYEFNGFITENNGSRNSGGTIKLQGIVNLIDSRVGDGGFCCVPGFHKELSKWTEMTKESRCAEKNNKNYTFVNVPKVDKMSESVFKVSARAGSLIVWSSELPHCNYPNDSSRFRMNYYIKMFPAQEGAKGTDIRKEMINFYLDGKEVSALGRKLFGLETWKE